jgi:rod shape-determining protein MreB
VLRVDSVEIAGAIAEPVDTIIKTVCSALEDIPPELSADVIDRGILLSGGGALLRNLDTRLHREVGLPLTLAEDPLRTVILGAARLLGCVNGFRQLMVRH